MTRIALCQIPVSGDPVVNLRQVRESLARAADDGAELAIFPEAALTRYGKRILELAEPLDGPFVTGLAEAARTHGLSVIAGVFEPVSARDGGRVSNTAVAVGPDGEVRAAYRKIHLFDSFGARESALVAPGDEPVVVELAGLRVGLVTCYDIRFPELTRALADLGADLFAVIAAWGSGPMKEEHWATLVRARAIENTTWTAAVGQAPNPEAADGFGIGRSMLVDPMGVVRADLGPAPAVQTCVLDPQITIVTRNALPCLEHRRLGVNRS
ncbi:carbon-nitrogen hydrolase family protein [Planomonospora sp. ID67723]|uniref:carbon-nitrogen hydrolase family protein n=1 Tax=Planomonospora sp. ID67723 TaxID=2738134 RepID=UPI0018C3A056|nr:carbon-nitrogen hydrolase family protein [Planomonospora sp. ID67723]MBG0830924.1 carbon-nitrogen hydrolase family protein [Planomonospora sp. ID67723]